MYIYTGFHIYEFLTDETKNRSLLIKLYWSYVWISKVFLPYELLTVDKKEINFIAEKFHLIKEAISINVISDADMIVIDKTKIILNDPSNDKKS